jgi:hypothetical protein
VAFILGWVLLFQNIWHREDYGGALVGAVLILANAVDDVYRAVRKR